MTDNENSRSPSKLPASTAASAASQRSDIADGWRVNRSVSDSPSNTCRGCLFFLSFLLVVYRRYGAQRGVGFTAWCKSNSKRALIGAQEWGSELRAREEGGAESAPPPPAISAPIKARNITFLREVDWLENYVTCNFVDPKSIYVWSNKFNF